MRRKPLQLLVLALIAVFVATAAGCGSKKSSAPPVTTTTTTTEATTAASTATTSATTTQTTTTAATTTPAVAGLGALTGSCAQLANLGQAFGSAISGAGNDPQKEAALLQQFADKTPSDIRPDFETLAAAFSKIASALKGVDLSSGKVPNASTLAKLTALSSQLNTADLTKAEANISAWAAKNCHA